MLVEIREERRLLIDTAIDLGVDIESIEEFEDYYFAHALEFDEMFAIYNTEFIQR